MRKTCLALECIRVVTCSTAFLVRLFMITVDCTLVKNVFPGKCLHWLLYLVDEKAISYFREKKIIKFSEKRERIRYLYRKKRKDQFFIIFKIL